MQNVGRRVNLQHRQIMVGICVQYHRSKLPSLLAGSIAETDREVLHECQGISVFT